MGQSISKLCNQDGVDASKKADRPRIIVTQNEPSRPDSPYRPPEKPLALQVPMHMPALSYKTLSNKSNKDTKEGSGSIKDLAQQSKFAVEDFTFYNILGVGDFGKVFLARYLYNDQFYAIKIIKKRQITVRHTSLKQILTERQVLACCESRFIVKMFASFQNDNNFYFVLEYVSAGNLSNYLRKMKCFSVPLVQFCVAEILIGLQYLHEEVHVIHRDLKPENILLDNDGHLKLTDFALAKVGVKQTHSFCGTKCYFSPELILNKGYDHMVDYWTLGCLTYEMLVGRPPFYHSNHKILFETILAGTYKKDIIEDEVAVDFIDKLLERNPAKRLGVNGIQDIFSHPFLAAMDIESLKHLEVESPLKPFIVERKPEALIGQQQSLIKRAISNSELAHSVGGPSMNNSNNNSVMSNTSNADLAAAIKKLAVQQANAPFVFRED